MEAVFNVDVVCGDGRKGLVFFEKMFGSGFLSFGQWVKQWT
jgi:hypothetical protein